MVCIYEITFALKWDFAEKGWIEEKEKVAGNEDALQAVERLKTEKLAKHWHSQETKITYIPQGFRLRGVTLLAQAP